MQIKTSYAAAGFSALALCILLADPAKAQQSTSQDIPAPSGNALVGMPGTTIEGVPELVIAGHVVMRLRATAGGLTPEERAYSLTQRIGPILTLPDLSANDVTVQQTHPGATASIYVRDRLLVTVDRNLAAANNTSIGALAKQWTRNLQATLPQVNVAVRMSGGTSWSASSSLPPASGMIGKKP